MKSSLALREPASTVSPILESYYQTKINNALFSPEVKARIASLPLEEQGWAIVNAINPDRAANKLISDIEIARSEGFDTDIDGLSPSQIYFLIDTFNIPGSLELVSDTGVDDIRGQFSFLVKFAPRLVEHYELLFTNLLKSECLTESDINTLARIPLNERGFAIYMAINPNGVLDKLDRDIDHAIEMGFRMNLDGLSDAEKFYYLDLFFESKKDKQLTF